jgi:urease accessory protein UreE
MLQMFKPLPVAREVCREEIVPAHARDYARDAITLGWEARLKARGRRISDTGLEFGTALKRGTILRAGDCFVLDQTRVLIVVAERAEPVFVIRPASTEEWALFAYHIGNNHQPMMIADAAIVCPDVPGIVQVLEQHGIPFSRAGRTFTPVGVLADHRHE